MSWTAEYSNLLSSVGGLATTIVVAYSVKTEVVLDPKNDSTQESELLKRFAIVLAIVLIAVLFVSPDTFTVRESIVSYLKIGIIVMATSLLGYFFCRAFGTRVIGTKRFITGFWLTDSAKAHGKALNLSTEKIIAQILLGKPSNIDKIWSRLSRTTMYCLMLLSATGTIIASTASVCLAMALLTRYEPSTFSRDISNLVKQSDFIQEMTVYNQYPSDFTATAESIMLQFENKFHEVRANISDEDLEKCRLAVNKYCQAKQDYERGIDPHSNKAFQLEYSWLNVIKKYYREIDQNPKLAQTVAMEELSVIGRHIKTLAPTSPEMAIRLTSGFQLASELDPKDENLEIRMYRMILHLKKAQLPDLNNVGVLVWDPAELQLLADYAKKYTESTSIDKVEDKWLDVILNTTTRYLNYEVDFRDKHDRAVADEMKMLVWSKSSFKRALANIKMTNFSIVVNYSKLNEEHALNTVYDISHLPVSEEFYPNKSIDANAIRALIDKIDTDTIKPLLRVKAELGERREWFHRANVSLDIARAFGLEAQLYELDANSIDQKKSVDNACGQLLEIINSEQIDDYLKHRLLCDLAKHPEYQIVRESETMKPYREYFKATCK